MLTSTKHKISIFTAVMNRNKRMTETIENWLQFDWIDEIVIVDWSSKTPFKYDHAKVIVARVEDEDNWILSQAFNLAARLTTGDILLKMDSDYRLRKEFYKNLLPIPHGYYSHGTWEGPWIEDETIDDNDKYLNGLLALRRKDFFEVNGYNERIVSYGYDDTDLYERLNKILKPILIRPEYGVWHEPHDDNKRVANQDVKDLVNDWEISWEKNKILSELDPWTIKDDMIDWKIVNGVYRK